MSIELTFVGYKDSLPIYSPIDKKDQDALMGHAVIECSPKKTGTRTSRQNRAMHLFFARLVEALNDAGVSGYQMERIGIPDTFVEHGPQNLLRSKYGIDADAIVETAQHLMTSSGKQQDKWPSSQAV